MYNVSFVPYNGDGNFLGYCNITADNKFRLSSICVNRSEKSEDGFFLSMTAFSTGRKDDEGRPVYKDYYYPINKEFRRQLVEAVKKSMEIGEAVEICRDERTDFSIKVKRISNKTDSSKDTGKRANVIVCLSRGLSGQNADFVIDSYCIREALSGDKMGKLFISAPSKKDKSGKYGNLCFPITKDFRSELYSRMMDAYDNEVIKAAAIEEKLSYEKV